MTFAGPGASWREPHSFLGWIMREMLARQAALAVLGSALLLAALPTFVLSILDPRTFGDANVWIKPLKFMVSLALFALTMAWFVGYVRSEHRRRWPVLTIAAVITAASLFEVSYITVQAARAEGSHFNVGDAFHAAMYSLMGVGAVSLTATALALAIIIGRHSDPKLAQPFKTSLVLGLMMTFVLGTATGAFMSAQAGHFAAGLTTAPSLPILGWSTVGGDWRVAHFFGMHAQQVVPAFGALVAWTKPSGGTTWVLLFSASYVILTFATLLQAKLNLPFITL